jgi:hypothetical protein
MMLVIFPILMRTASLTLYDTMDVTVHNQYPDVELVSPVYFCNHCTCNEYPIRRTDGGAMMNTDIRFDIGKLPGGIWMYEVQRKGSTESDHQSSTDTISTEVVEDTSKIVRLLMIWKIEDPEEPEVCIILVEHSNELVLNEDKLAQLYDKANDRFYKFYDSFQSTWLVCDNTVLKATYKIVWERGLELEITISEGVKDEYPMKPMWIDSERQVSSLMVIYSMLIYIVSLTLQSAVDVTIHNLCADIELTSPVHFIKDAMCHILLPQHVDSESIMKISFRTSMDQDTFGGALLYRLQRKEDTSTNIRLLVIWGWKSYRFYSHVWLIEHESKFIWNEDELKRLYDTYNSRYDIDFSTEEWSLGDDMKLRIVCETSHKGDFEMNIAIFEEDYLLYPTKPLWIDSNRQVSTELMVSCIDLMLSVLFSMIYSQYLFIISVQSST